MSWPVLAACVGLVGVISVVSARAAEPKRGKVKDPNDLAAYDKRVTDEDRSHWAFQPIERPEVPDVKDPAWARNPIDRFVLATLDEQGWKPAPPAAPAALLRRVYLDVTGLQPTPEERAAFLQAAERDPVAYERLVDNLLARPGFGERWGRHWLDLVRYAESNGYERDATKPFAWRYRDYVIRSVNNDLPFNQFLTEQLAGDELPEGQFSLDSLIATGYYRLGPWDDEPADPKQDRFDQLDDIIVTTSEVFLGLTLGCARCHDHKFEPLTGHDYYRMAAVFAPLERPRKERTELTVPLGTPAQRAALARRDARIAELEKKVAAIEPASTPLGQGLRAAVAAEAGRLRKETPDLPEGYVLNEPSASAPVTHLLLRGQATAPGPVVGPGVPAVLTRTQPAFPPAPTGASTTRRRLALAKWLTGPDNPLTARVIVNRVWQGHFGAGLVRTPSDFGTMGDPPTHPELLDWLARWFVDNGWSMKKLHKLILTSSTYRMSVKNNTSYATEDPDDRLLWRRPYRRLEAEPIRDAMLAATGRLDRRMYGPAFFPFVPPAALQSHSDPETVWPKFNEAAADRRTVYAFIKRSLVVPMLDLLDLCDTARSAARRNVTSVPTQALTLLNGDFVNRQSHHLAARLEREASTDPARIDRAFLLVLCRPPTDRERAEVLAFLDGESASGAPEARHEALVQACRALFNTNEFVYPD